MEQGRLLGGSPLIPRTASLEVLGLCLAEKQCQLGMNENGQLLKIHQAFSSYSVEVRRGGILGQGGGFTVAQSQSHHFG